MDFRKINFGKADAQEEGVEFPELLKYGYYDNDHVVKQIHETSKFLILGYKGSGKSALSEHLKLSASIGMSVEQISLKEFPYKMFSKIVAGESEQEYKLKVAWRWLLLVQILSSLLKDSDAKQKDNIGLNDLTTFLTQSGIFPLVSMSGLISRTTSRTFQGTLRNFSLKQTTNSENAQISFEWLIEFIKDVITNFVEMHQHYLVIDGLDDILTSREIQYLSIAALVNEVKDLNLFFRKSGMPFKIIVLCRTDIFERLPDANKNKIRRDCSYTFTWYKEGEDSQKECGLIDIMNLRGRLVYNNIENVIDSFFPSDTANVTNNAIVEGIKVYSSEYFLPEIKDGLAGYIPYNLIDPLINILSSFRVREFSYSQFVNAFNDLNMSNDINVDFVLNVLYDCSAIGHAYPYKNGRETRVTFKYRNRHSSFNKENRIILHKGLWKALNVNF